jgi:hypothetical protein
MLPSNRRQCNTLDHRACPEGRAVRRQYAFPAIGSLFNIAQSPEPAFAFFLAICFPIKRTARLSPAVQVREETPRGRAATAGGGVAVAYRILQIQRPRALTRLNFRSVSCFCVATVPIAADHVGGTWTPCSRRNAPTTLIASATKRPRVSASASPTRAVILRSNTIDVPLATSAQFKVRARNGFTLRSPCFRPKIAQFAAMRWPASRYLNP